MDQYVKIGWWSLVFLFIFEIAGIGWFHLRGNVDLVALALLLVLPGIQIYLQEVKKDFFCLELYGNYQVAIKHTIVILSGLTLYMYGASVVNIMIGVYSAFCLLFVFESRITFLLSLISLFFCSLFLVLDRQIIAANCAVFTYYLLAIGLVTQILEQIVQKSRNEAQIIKERRVGFERFLSELSAYFEMMNILLGIWIFVRIFLSVFQGMPVAGVDIYLFMYIVGYLYNASYQNENSLFEGKKSFDRWILFFIVGINLGMYLLLREFLVENGVHTYVLPIIAWTLVVLDEVIFFLSTDIFKKRLSH